MNVIYAPQPFAASSSPPRLFLAGSIEMGAAEDWQTRLTNELAEIEPLIILNPRRKDWDSSWKQEAANPQFAQQVRWELQAQEAAEVIAMYFDPATKSPITLLELGLFVRKKTMVVCCPDGYWRKGNVDIVCEYFGQRRVMLCSDWRGFVSLTKLALQAQKYRSL